MTGICAQKGKMTQNSGNS